MKRRKYFHAPHSKRRMNRLVKKKVNDARNTAAINRKVSPRQLGHLRFANMIREDASCRGGKRASVYA